MALAVVELGVVRRRFGGLISSWASCSGPGAECFNLWCMGIGVPASVRAVGLRRWRFRSLTGTWCYILVAFSGVSALAFDNSRSVLCLATANYGVRVVGFQLPVGMFLVPLIWPLGHFDLGSRVNHFVGRRCGTRRAWVKG